MIDFIKVNTNLNLRRIALSDADDVFKLVDKHRKHLRTWLPFVDTTHSVENTRAFIDNLKAPFSRELVFTVCYEDVISGLIGFKDIDRINRKMEIGYWISPEYEGMGIITQSCRVLITKAFEKMDMNRIQIKCGVGNYRSSNIPKRLGFMFEGVERDGERHTDRFIDLEVYSMLRKDWDA